MNIHIFYLFLVLKRTCKLLQSHICVDANTLIKLLNFLNLPYVLSFTEENEKHQENIAKGLTQLLANKYTIKKALSQTDSDPIGLPIPVEQHRYANL